jgi:hypothetical protein
MTLYQKIVALALEKYPDIGLTDLRNIPTLSESVEVIGGAVAVETIMMDWLDAAGNPMMGWGPKTNVLIVHRSVVALLRADAGPEEAK